MIPILFSKNENTFTHNGFGFLKDAVKCTVTEERNGAYECSFQYPITGQWYEQITDGCIIKAKPNDSGEPQLFRIYKINKPLNGIVTYSAEHISYDLNGIPLLGFLANNATPQTAINEAISEAGLPCPFTAVSDISTQKSTAISAPCSIRAILGGQTGSVLDTWGGEYEFDNFTIKLHKHRGSDSGVLIEYGKNLKDLNQEQNISDCFTHLMPYARYSKNGEDGESSEVYVYLPEKILSISDAENFGHSKACIMDFTDSFGDGAEITNELLRAKATAYIGTAQLGIPKVTISVSFVQLWQTEEYKNIAPLERVNLCDIVTVRFSKLGVEAKAKVIKTVYDSLNERYESITLGDAKETLADSIIETDKSISAVKRSVERAEAHITRTDERITAEVIRAKGEEEKLSAKIELTAESITLEVTRATQAEGSLSSRITQTAESITSEVTRAQTAESGLSDDINTLDTKLTSKIEQTAESITAEVTRATAAEGSLSSRITQTAESITSEVTRAQTAESGLSDDINTLDTNLTSKIEQTAESITAEVARATAAEGSLSSRITQTADSITAEITRAKAEEGKLSTRISQTFDNITLSVSEATANNQTSSTLTLKNGNVSIATAKVTGTTAAQVSAIAADAVNGITLSVTNSTTEASSTLTLKNGNVTIASGTIELKGLVTFSDLETKGKTEINGDNITTGKISADRIDVSSIYVTNVYATTSSSNKQVVIATKGSESLFIGGTGTQTNSNVKETYLLALQSVRIGKYYSGGNLYYNLYIDVDKNVIRPSNSNSLYDWDLGSSDYPFANLYTKTAQLGNNWQGKVGFFGTTPASRQTVSQLSTNATLSGCITKINSLLSALQTYGLISL